CLLPVLLFGGAILWDDFYAQGIFLLAVLPAGVTAPALTAIFKGRMELSLILLVISSLLCPLAMPFLSKWILGSVLKIDAWGMLLSLSITVIGPFLIFWPLRNRTKVVDFARKINTPVVISLMGVFVITVTAQNRDLIFAEPVLLIWHLLVACGGYGLFYVVGWYGWWGGRFAERLAVSFASGANNIALGIAVGYTYFSPEIGFFFIAGQLAWTLMLAPVQRLVKKYETVGE
ncbi:MAG: bile acid:sodium symporter, partial [Bacteroidota bacterium]